MTYGQDPQMLAKLGGPSDFTKDPAFIQALARIIAQQGMRSGTQMTPGLMEGMSQGAAEDGFRQDAAQSRAQYGMMQDGSPNALQGGRTSGFADAVAEGDPNSELYRMYVGEPPTPPNALAQLRTHGPEIYSERRESFIPSGMPNPGDFASALAETLGAMSQGQTPPAVEQGGGVPGAIGRGADLVGNFWNKAYHGAKDELNESRGSFNPAEGGMSHFTEIPGAKEFYGGGAETSMQEQALGAQTPMTDLATKMAGKPPSKKKKGEYSDFFKLLKAAKSGDKTTKKSITDLAKQLEASGGEVPVS